MIEHGTRQLLHLHTTCTKLSSKLMSLNTLQVEYTNKVHGLHRALLEYEIMNFHQEDLELLEEHTIQ